MLCTAILGNLVFYFYVVNYHFDGNCMYKLFKEKYHKRAWKQYVLLYFRKQQRHSLFAGGGGGGEVIDTHTIFVDNLRSLENMTMFQNRY